MEGGQFQSLYIELRDSDIPTEGKNLINNSFNPYIYRIKGQ